MDELLKTLTDPVANKIIQYIRVHETTTAAEILLANTELSRATLYRKIEKLLAVGAIKIVGHNKIRGQEEKIYAVDNIYITNQNSNEERMKTVTLGLMGIVDLYENYFKEKTADVNRDKLFMLNYGIRLNDEDFSNMLKELMQTVDKYQAKQNTEDAKLRNIYLLSAPCRNE
ncbi:MAG: hypothetical protein MJ105_08215 [Lachnospiraceae bacterium]|nr:hypothetical protein [Lachnospiraceae bacterium]